MNQKLITLISSIPNWKAKNAKSLVNAINRMPGVLVKDLKYSDLMLPASQCNGVYVFQQGQNFQIVEHDEKCQPVIMKDPVYWYVGKAGGRALVDRIGAHFAPRHDDYMNVLLKSIAWLLSKYKSQTQKDFMDSKDVDYKNTYIEKAFNVIQDLYIKVIAFDIPQSNLKSYIALAESTLKAELCPLLNDVNRPKKRQQRKLILTL